MIVRRELGLLILAVLLMIARIQAHASTDVKASQLTAVPGEIVVQLKDSTRATIQMGRVLKTLNKRAQSYKLSIRSDAELPVLKIDDITKTAQAISDLKKSKEIKYAEPNYIYYPLRESGLPTDVDLPLQWSIRNTGQKDASGQVGIPGEDIDILRVWRQGFTGNRRVVVAVIDTGVDYNHPDLASNIWKNPGEIPGNGIDDDHNGFIDDVRGWDFQNNDNDPMDDNRHGTHCAGVIGAEGNNSMGIAGLNHRVSILPIKFLGNSGGTLEGGVKSIQYATLMKVNIMSNSWGGGGESQILKEAIEKARDAGILFVAAAGNSSADNDATDTFPANYDVSNVLSVAAIDNQGKLAKFSNYGRKKVHVAAPGVKIHSTVIDGRYEALSGTSMACPHVAGVAALMLSRKRYQTAEEIKERIMRTVVKVPALRSKVASKGRVSAFNAVYGQVPPSDEPEESDWIPMSVDLESAHPYDANVSSTWTLQAPEPSKFIRAHFTRIDTESNYDFLTLSSGSGEEFFKFSGKATDMMTDYVTGNTIQVKFTSDPTQQRWGFKLDRIEYIR